MQMSEQIAPLRLRSSVDYSRPRLFIPKSHGLGHGHQTLRLFVIIEFGL